MRRYLVAQGLLIALAMAIGSWIGCETSGDHVDGASDSDSDNDSDSDGDGDDDDDNDDGFEDDDDDDDDNDDTDTSGKTLSYLWVANTDDLNRGTVSKVDSKALKEVGRYYTVTCDSQPGTSGCVDVNGSTITAAHEHTPSRTAVDFNMDVWVANRNLDGGQPSATKIAADPLDCIDRNNNGKIDTSADNNGDGKITTDCNGDGKADDINTQCSGNLAGKAPEFLGYDDECVLFTVNYGQPNDIARSVCLDSGKSIVGASDAWVGTYWSPEKGHGPNKYYKLDGNTGKTLATVTMPDGHHAYGCTADAHHIIWSTDIGYYNTTVAGNLTYFQALPPYAVGKVMRGGNTGGKPSWIGANGKYRHYGICTDPSAHIWLGGINSEWVLRYKPNRASFDTLGQGTWTRIDMPSGFRTRGVAADLRGKVWVAIQKGHILRLDQSIGDGVHDKGNAQKGGPVPDEGNTLPKKSAPVLIPGKRGCRHHSA